MPTPRVAAVHDLSGFGRCSLSIVMPTLSAMGVQCCPVPTAYLSTHTGGFTGNTFLDLTDQMAPVTSHWKAENVTFDAVYTGFMGSCEQMTLTADLIRTFKTENNVVVIDPVMGDHGKPYRTYTAEMCAAMGELAREADVLTPNRTEAAILLDVPYEELRLDTEDDCRKWAKALSLDGKRSVVLTGVSLEKGSIGAVCYDRKGGEVSFVSAKQVDARFHGTGDLFASVLTGALVRGKNLHDAARLASEFVSLTAAHTAAQDIPLREGVDFEPLLWRLGRSFSEGGTLA
ncbi:MAG: pyridoxamine kinase [Oscillospiraceae bacterium]|nr:pyridoxamine kinase [Oscillospiraceae bacterium]